MDIALSEVKLALEADPNMGPAHNLRGLIYGNLGEAGLAEESFRRALTINARDSDALQNYGWFLCTQKRYAEGQAQFTTALAIPQNRINPRIYRTLGVCQNMAGQWAEAENSLQRAIDIEPNNPATAFNLAEVLYRRGDYERARFYIRRVNSQQGVMNAQTLWLAVRIEKRLGNQSGVRELGNQLREPLPRVRARHGRSSEGSSMTEHTPAAGAADKALPPRRGPARVRCCDRLGRRRACTLLHWQPPSRCRRASSTRSRTTATTNCSTPPSRAPSRRPSAAR